jgi:hypothetical protein
VEDILFRQIAQNRTSGFYPHGIKEPPPLFTESQLKQGEVLRLLMNRSVKSRKAR